MEVRKQTRREKVLAKIPGIKTRLRNMVVPELSGFELERLSGAINQLNRLIDELRINVEKEANARKTS